MGFDDFLIIIIWSLPTYENRYSDAFRFTFLLLLAPSPHHTPSSKHDDDNYRMIFARLFH